MIAAPFSKMGRQRIVNAAPTLTPFNHNLDNIIFYAIAILEHIVIVLSFGAIMHSVHCDYTIVNDNKCGLSAFIIYLLIY